MKRIILTILLCGVIVWGLTGCGSVDDATKDLKESQEKYGFVEKECVDVLVAKFNTEVVDNSSLNPASNDYLIESNNQYWYGLVEGIYLVVVPKEYTGDKQRVQIPQLQHNLSPMSFWLMCLPVNRN